MPQCFSRSIIVAQTNGLVNEEKLDIVNDDLPKKTSYNMLE